MDIITLTFTKDQSLILLSLAIFASLFGVHSTSAASGVCSGMLGICIAMVVMVLW